MGLREDKKAATRAAIIEVALSLFRTLGFDRARVQDVVDRLRISEATFFNYFPSKQSVLDAAAVELVGQSLDVLRTELDDGSRTVRDRLDDVTRQFADSFDGDRELAVLLARHTRLLLVGSDRDTEGRELLTRLFTSGQESGEVRSDVPPAYLVDLYLTQNLAAINGWIAEGDDPGSLAERLRLAQLVFWTGTTAPRAAHDRGAGEPAVVRKQRRGAKGSEGERRGAKGSSEGE